MDIKYVFQLGYLQILEINDITKISNYFKLDLKIKMDLNINYLKISFFSSIL